MQHAPWSDIGRIQQEVNELQRQLYSKAGEGKVNEVIMKLEYLERKYRELNSRISNIESSIQLLQEFQRNQEMLRPDY